MTSLVFFGTGPVAADSLALIAKSFDVEAVVTKPRPAGHRGTVPVEELAKELNLPLLYATDKASLDELFESRPVKSQLAVLIDFGIIVSQQVIDYFPLGIINSHFSLLPEWRGADPITFAVLTGQKITGVSLMLLVEKMDEGPLLTQASYDIKPDETSSSLTDALIDVSYRLLLAVLPHYAAGAIVPYEQTERSPAGLTLKTSYSRKLSKADGLLDWHKPAAQLERQVRAYSSWPQSRTTIAGKDVIITASHVAESAIAPVGVEIGNAFATPDKQLCITTGEGILVVDTLKPAGKPDMSAPAFLAGYGSTL